jgi:hypothetical protein
MSLANYAGLKQEIADHLDRDDLTSNIDTFIDLAEARHKRELRVRDMLTRASFSLSTRFLDIPTGFLAMKNLRLLTSPISLPREVGIDEVNRWRDDTAGTPRFYSIHSQIEFDRAPAAAVSAELIYYVAPTALSDANTTNDILTNHPDVYLYEYRS